MSDDSVASFIMGILVGVVVVVLLIVFGKMNGSSICINKSLIKRKRNQNGEENER